MNISKFFVEGYNACMRDESSAPTLNPVIRRWLEENDPHVGDGRFVEICNAFNNGYLSAIDDLDID